VIQLRQCGVRGTFTLKEYAAIDKDVMIKALKANQLEIDSVEKVIRQRPQRELSFSLPKPPS
jgi:hypothetical protein